MLSMATSEKPVGEATFPRLHRRLRWYHQRAKILTFRIKSFRKSHLDLDGIRLSLDSDGLSPFMRWKFHTGYEAHERDLLLKYLSPEDRILEVGAGVGYLALLALLKVGVSRYVMVEANAKLVPLIHKNLALNNVDPSHYEVIEAIVTDSATSARFDAGSDFWTGHIADGGEGPTLPTLSTARLTERMAFRPTALIMDIEGAETGISFENFAGVRKVLIEIHPDFVGPNSAGEVISRLHDRGFRLRDYAHTSFYLERQ
jgi:FkbM family methyltransferase